MKKSSLARQHAQYKEAKASLIYAYHEAGHAIVGHVIGRLIALVSIKETNYHPGCCRFDAFSESMNQHDQWQKGSNNPELLTILYGGMVAVHILCEQKGWDYSVLETGNLQDEAEIEHIACEMFKDEERRITTLGVCRNQAYDLLMSHWNAVKALAGELRALKWVTGAEAHTIIWDAVGKDTNDWRCSVLKDDPLIQRRATFDAERKRLVVDFTKGLITEQELDDQWALLQEERQKALQNSPLWRFYGSFF